MKNWLINHAKNNLDWTEVAMTDLNVAGREGLRFSGI